MGVWTFDPFTFVLVAVTAALYAHGFVRLRRRSRRHAPATRAWLFAAGLLVALAALVSPIDELGEDRLLSAHMAQHLLLGDLAPLLLVLGLRGPLALFVVPASVLRGVGHAPAARRVLGFVTRPRVAFVAWVTAAAAWHVPAAYDFALAHPWAHVLEHATFALAGVLVWTTIVDPAQQHRLSPGARALFACAIFGAGMVLSEILLAAGPLYPHYAHVLRRPFGLSAKEDQSRAALLMMAEQVTTLGLAAALLLWTHIERLEAPDDDEQLEVRAV